MEWEKQKTEKGGERSADFHALFVFVFFYDHVLKVNGVVRLSFGLKCNLGYGYI